MTRRALLVAVIAAAALAGASGIRAELPDDAEGDKREQWQTEFRDARQHLALALERRADALVAYQHIRHRRRQRGESKQAVIDELEAARSAVPEAQTRLRELYEAARHADVPPGWMRIDASDRHPSASVPEDT